MKFHPLSELFPLMQGREFDELVADIKANGLRESIWTYQGQILDGRNRWRACDAANVVSRQCQEYQGTDPLGFVVSLNLHRRHLDESQRSVVAARIADMPHGGDYTSDRPIGTSLGQAAEMLNVGERSVKRAKEVLRDGALELVQAVESGRVSVSAAADVSELPKEQQREIVARGEKEILEAAKQIRTKRASEVEAKNQEARHEAAAIPPPSGQFRTVVIDPPWPMTKIDRDVRPNQVGMDYPTMSLEELADFPLPLADEAHVYVWTTQKFLPEALKLLSAWGLKYVFTMVWHKNGGPQPYNLPQYNCEFVVFGRKGSLDFLDTKQFFTAFNAPRREHSRKPDEFYELVKRVSPGPRIDIFSREPRDGFDQFGNEVKKFA